MSQPSHSPAEPPIPGSHYQPALSVVLIIVALFVGATFLMLRSPAPVSPNSTATPTTTKTTTTAAVHAKSTVRVQVANGTLTANLAPAHFFQIPAPRLSS